MMDVNVVSYQSAGPILIGMTKEEVRNVMSEKPNDYHNIRGPYTDYFEESNIFVYYTNEDGICEAIEFCEPTIALFNGKPINGIKFIEAMKWLEQFDSEIIYEKYVGLTSYKLGIGIYAPNYDEVENKDEYVEAVIVFKKGYYDKG